MILAHHQQLFGVGAAPLVPTNQFYVLFNDTSGNVTGVLASTLVDQTSIPVGSFPYRLKMLSDGSKIFTSDSGSDQVSVIDVATETVIDTIGVTDPLGMALSPDQTKLYVAEGSGSDNIRVINTSTHAIERTITLARTNSAEFIAISPDGGFLALGFGEPIIVDLSDDSLAFTLTGIFTCDQMQYSANGAKLYVISGTDVLVYETVGYTLTATIAIGTSIYGFCIVGTTMYVCGFGNDKVYFVNLTTETVTGNIDVDPDPFMAAADESGDFVYVVHYTTVGTLTEIQTSDNTVARTAFLPFDYPYDISTVGLP